jgi:hypothetical protein
MGKWKRGKGESGGKGKRGIGEREKGASLFYNRSTKRQETVNHAISVEFSSPFRKETETVLQS